MIDGSNMFVKAHQFFKAFFQMDQNALQFYSHRVYRKMTLLGKPEIICRSSTTPCTTFILVFCFNVLILSITFVPALNVFGKLREQTGKLKLKSHNLF